MKGFATPPSGGAGSRKTRWAGDTRGRRLVFAAPPRNRTSTGRTFRRLPGGESHAMKACAHCAVEHDDSRLTEIVEHRKKWRVFDEQVRVSVCDRCLARLEQAYEEETKNPNLWRAGLFSFAASAAMAAIVGFFAASDVVFLFMGAVGAVGWVAGAAVVGAGRKSGGRVALLGGVSCALSIFGARGQAFSGARFWSRGAFIHPPRAACLFPPSRVPSLF